MDVFQCATRIFNNANVISGMPHSSQANCVTDMAFPCVHYSRNSHRRMNIQKQMAMIVHNDKPKQTEPVEQPCVIQRPNDTTRTIQILEQRSILPGICRNQHDFAVLDRMSLRHGHTMPHRKNALRIKNHQNPFLLKVSTKFPFCLSQEPPAYPSRVRW